MYCSKCGQQIADNAMFCSHCGTKLMVPQPQPVQEQQPTDMQEKTLTPEAPQQPVKPFVAPPVQPSAPKPIPQPQPVKPFIAPPVQPTAPKKESVWPGILVIVWALGLIIFACIHLLIEYAVTDWWYSGWFYFNSALWILGGWLHILPAISVKRTGPKIIAIGLVVLHALYITGMQIFQIINHLNGYY